MKKILLLGVMIALTTQLKAENLSDNVAPDTIPLQFHLNEVVVSSSPKETNDLKTLPAAVTFITPYQIEGRKISNIKDLSTIVPNFFIADYGSKLSVPVYIRGIGERSTGQSIGVYVDNTPYSDKSAFDFEWMDIAQIEVLRGPQGTLYGRNAMGGIVSIRTRSPLDSSFGKVMLTAGNYGLFKAKATVSKALSKKTGIAASGYYEGNQGYFTNQHSGAKADRLRSAGGRFRFDWRINDYWEAQWAANYDRVNQGAYPYGRYDNGEIASPDYDAEGNYLREMAGTSLNLKYENGSVLFNSNTGFIYLDDDMKMDLDYTPESMFFINQKQKEYAWTEELTIKSVTDRNYQWMFGVWGFYNDLNTDVMTTMNGAALQSIFDRSHAANPGMPYITVETPVILIPGLFETPSYGGALFHQSTYNHLFVEGLSITGGIRLDYEKNRLDYDTETTIDLDLAINMGPMGTMHQSRTRAPHLQGDSGKSVTEFLPKIALKYEFDSKHYVYATVSNGYKTGGYNIQSFADIVRAVAQSPNGEEPANQAVIDLVSYKPEYSWNYEVGFKGELIKDVLYSELAAYYIRVSDIQLTDFVESGQGRIIKNAGKANSLGADLSLQALLTNEWSFLLNYGFTSATFTDYKIKENLDNEIVTLDYAGNHIPFAPQHTLSLSGSYNKFFHGQWIDRLNIQAQYNMAGKIYWTEANDVYQDVYGLLNLRAGINKGIWGVTLWANNVLNSKYTAFYFESMGNRLAQRGKPVTFGVDLNLYF